ncbi:MAG: hypothetical protein MK008_01895 [Bdellovibrionales bacterium]|nr:hypothetical protein [Bdellovibrionales bacterium]
MRKLIFSLLFTFFIFPQGYAQDYQGVDESPKNNSELSSFLKGLQLYKNQQYQESFEQFLQAYNQDKNNPNVLFNLGLSAMNAEKIGYTIGAWRKAQFVSPLFFQAHRALKAFNEKNPKALKMTSWLDRYFLTYVPAELLFSLHGVALVYFGFLMLRVRKIRRQALKENIDFSFQPFLTKTLVSGSLFVLLSFFTAFKAHSLIDKKASLIASQPLYVTPSAEATFVNEVEEGDVVQVESEQSQWTQIKTSKGAIGWVPSQNLFVFSGWDIW